MTSDQPKRDPSVPLAAWFFQTCRIIFLGVALVAPARAQQVGTIGEAAQINGGLALQFCMAQGVDGPQTAAMFRQAGFAERVERSTGNSDTTHYFTAPSNSVRAELYYGETAPYCSVYSDHMSATVAGAIVDQIVPKLRPGYVRKVETGPVNPATGKPAQCVRYEDPTNPIGEVIGAGPGGAAQSCIDNGRTHFFITYRV